MKYKFVQHIPGFVDAEPKRFESDDKEEMLNYLKKFLEQDQDLSTPMITM